MTGSALPAMVCHIVNNVLFTLLTASFPLVTAVPINVVLLVAGLAVFAASVTWLRWSLASAPLPPAPLDPEE